MMNETRSLNALFNTAMNDFIHLWPLEGLDERIQSNTRGRQFSLADRPRDEGPEGPSRFYLDNANFNLYEYRIPDLVQRLWGRLRLGKSLYGYQNLGGREDVRESLAELARLRSGRFHDRSLTPWNVYVGNGATSLLEKTFESIRLLCGPGKEIVYHKPVYPVIPFLILKSGAKPVAISTVSEHKFLPTLEEIKKVVTSRTIAVCLVYPCNPSGTTLTDREELRKIFSFVRQRGLFLVIDEVYQDTTHRGFRHISSLGLTDSMERFITITSLSKDRPGFNDLRLGYAVGDPRLLTIFHLLTSAQEWQPPSFCQDLLLFDTCMRIARMTGRRSLALPRLGLTLTAQEVEIYNRQTDAVSEKIERHVKVIYRALRDASAVEDVLAPEAGNILFFKLRSSWYRKRGKNILDYLMDRSVSVRDGRYFLMKPGENWFRITVTHELDYMLDGLYSMAGLSGRRKNNAIAGRLRTEIGHDPKNGRLLTSYACRLLNNANYREVLKVLKKIPAAGDFLTNYRVRYLRGASLLGQGELRRAIRFLTEAVRSPIDKAHLWFEGQSVSQDYYREQLALYGKAWLHYNLGVAYSFLKQRGLSERHLRRARRLGYELGGPGEDAKNASSEDCSRPRVVFRIATRLNPNRWYKEIFVTESRRNGDLVRSMCFGNPGSVPESAFVPGRPDLIVKNSNLPCIFALAFLKKRVHRFLIIGLGGGTLPRFIRRYFSESSIDIVEIDGAVLEAARHMEFREDEKMRVRIQSYTETLKTSAASRYDLVLFDLDVVSLVDGGELRRMRRCLTPDGVLVINCFMPDEMTRCSDHEENKTRLLALFEVVHVFRPTEKNYEYVCLSQRNPVREALDIDGYISGIWERLPGYPLKDDIAGRIRDSYGGAERARSAPLS